MEEMLENVTVGLWKSWGILPFCTELSLGEDILNAGHEMRPIQETMTVLHLENVPKRITALEEMEIMKATSSDHMFNIMQNINLLYQMLQPLQDQIVTGTNKF